MVPLRIPAASTLAGLAGYDQDLLKGSVGGALEARGGIFMLPLPFKWEAGTAKSCPLG